MHNNSDFEMTPRLSKPIEPINSSRKLLDTEPVNFPTSKDIEERKDQILDIKPSVLVSKKRPDSVGQP